jgi:hypothetical protein
MKYVWPALLGFFRTTYAAYAVWCKLFPVALVGMIWLLCSDFTHRHPALRFLEVAGLAVFIGMALYAVWYSYKWRDANDPNPWQSGFMAWFGTLKWFKNSGGAAAVHLFWRSTYLVENPRGYRISGSDLREILGLLQPGDILLRGYEGYVDGEFIRRSSLSSQKDLKPGWFTHVALYAGELTEQDRTHVSAAFQNQADYFATGPQMVIHAMAKGVHVEDILTFLRCDYLCVLRLPTELSLKPGNSVDTLVRCKQANPPSLSDQMVTSMQDDLHSGLSIARDSVIAAARLSALEKIGEEYDFDCSDTTTFDRFSCAELLYYCLRGVLGALDLKPQPHALFPLAPWFKQFHLLERATLTPDDYDDLVKNGNLLCIWKDQVSKTK